MYNSRPGVRPELRGPAQPVTPAARPAPPVPTGPQHAPGPRPNGTGNYAPFPQFVRPPANVNPAQTVVYANNPVQNPTIPPPAQRPNAPRTPQYANAPQAIYANNPVQNNPTIPAPGPQRPTVPSRPQFSAESRSQVDGLPPSVPKAKPYMAKIPDKAQIEKFLAERAQGGNGALQVAQNAAPQLARNGAPQVARNAAPGVKPNAPTLPQPANVQRGAAPKTENPYGQLSAAIMNGGARQPANPYGKMTDVKNAGPAKAENPYGKMTDVAAGNGMPAAPTAPGKFSVVQQTASKALGQRRT